MNRRLTGYDYEIADKLKSTKMPFSCRMADFVLMEQVGDVELLRTFKDCVIELELLKEKANNELLKYKLRYGAL